MNSLVDMLMLGLTLMKMFSSLDEVVILFSCSTSAEESSALLWTDCGGGGSAVRRESDSALNGS